MTQCRWLSAYCWKNVASFLDRDSLCTFLQTYTDVLPNDFTMLRMFQVGGFMVCATCGKHVINSMLKLGIPAKILKAQSEEIKDELLCFYDELNHPMIFYDYIVTATHICLDKGWLQPTRNCGLCFVGNRISDALASREFGAFHQLFIDEVIECIVFANEENEDENSRGYYNFRRWHHYMESLTCSTCGKVHRDWTECPWNAPKEYMAANPTYNKWITRSIIHGPNAKLKRHTQCANPSCMHGKSPLCMYCSMCCSCLECTVHAPPKFIRIAYPNFVNVEDFDEL